MVKSRRDRNPNAVEDVNFEVDRIFKRFNIVSFFYKNKIPNLFLE